MEFYGRSQYNDDINVTETEERRTFGLGLDAGIEYKLSTRFFLEARYTYGFISQINELSNPGDLSEGGGILDGKRNTFRIGLGYKF